MIYTVETKRMQVWRHRIRAADCAQAKTFGDELADFGPPHDDYGYETTCAASKDQAGEADND